MTRTFWLEPEVLRGLELMRRHLDDGGHDWSLGTAMGDVKAARDWLDAVSLDSRASMIVRIFEITRKLSYLDHELKGAGRNDSCEPDCIKCELERELIQLRKTLQKTAP